MDSLTRAPVSGVTCLNNENIAMRLLIIFLLAVPFSSFAESLIPHASYRVADLLVPSEEYLSGIRSGAVAHQLKSRPEMAEHRDFILSVYNKYFTRESFITVYAALYRNNFSEDDLNVIADFYETEAGQKLLQKKLELDQQTDKLLASQFQKMGPAVQKEIAAYMKEKK